MKRRVSALLLALTLAVSLASGAFAATYSNWFKSIYEETHQLEKAKNRTDSAQSSSPAMDLKQPITRGEMCLLAVQAFEAADTAMIWSSTARSISPIRMMRTSPRRMNTASSPVIRTARSDPISCITRQEFFKLPRKLLRIPPPLSPSCPLDAIRPSASFGDASRPFQLGKGIAAQFCVTYSYVNGTKDASGSDRPRHRPATASRQEAIDHVPCAPLSACKEFY